MSDTAMKVTANERLAILLRERGGPQVLSFNQFTADCWQRLSAQVMLPRVLSGVEEAVLWQRLLEVEMTSEPLLSPGIVARKIQEAFCLVHEWGIEPSALQAFTDEETAFFLKMRRRFQATCDKENVISSAQVPDILQQHGVVPPCKKLVAIGWLEVVPQVRRFFDGLQARGIEVEFLEPAHMPATEVTCTRYQDAREELVGSLKAIAAAHQTAGDQQFALVVPGLVGQFESVNHLAQRILPAQSFRISGGRALIHEPMLAVIVSLLQWFGDEDIALTQMIALIRSRYVFGSKTHHEARLQLELKLREEAPQASAKADWLKWLRRFAADDPLIDMLNQLESIGATHTFAAWLAQMDAGLQSLGFAEIDALAGRELQVFEAFQKCRRELAAFGGTVNFSVFQKALLHLLESQLFQPQSPPHARIHILGMLETSGLRFDALWCVAMGQTCFPQRARPNPFLPIGLQISCHLPHSSSLRERQFAEIWLKALLTQTQKLHISYVGYQDDIEDELSALLAPYVTSDVDAVQATPAPAVFETVTDVSAPPVDAAEQQLLKGGSRILQSQALCPFQAFARFRLKAEAWPVGAPILDHKKRGQLTHEALAACWHVLADQQGLLLLEEQALQQLVRRQVAGILKRRGMASVFATLEEARLTQLIVNWLNEEKSRPAFKVIAHEKPGFGYVGRLRVKFRIDRIDEVASGERILIDYKTGIVSVNDWFSARPSEPQLPLYALFEEAHALAFVQLRQGALKAMGLAANDTLWPALTPVSESRYSKGRDWPALMQQFEGILQALAEEFMNGYADVSPKSVAEACEYCDLQPLCRINEKPSPLVGEGRARGEK